MTKLGLVKVPVTIDRLLVDGFVPSQGQSASPAPSPG
jgi:hypothetical protein